MDLKKRVTRKLLAFNLGYLALMVVLLGLIFVISRDEWDEIGPIFLFLIVFACVPFALFGIFYALGKYTGEYDRYVAGLDLAAQERFARELEIAPRLRGGIICRECVVLQNGMRLDLVPYERLVWAYKNRQSVYFYTMHQLIMVTDDKKLHVLNLNRKLFHSRETEDFLRFLLAKQPQLILGFDDDKARMFRTNFEGMKHLAGRD